MRLTGVTITGADDEVDIGELADLSITYPWVEWGILFSQKKQGTGRYPSEAWIDRLHDYGEMSAAAHLCGKYARDIQAGSEAWFKRWAHLFDRVQVNGVDVDAPGETLGVVEEWPHHTVIFQATSANDLLLVPRFRRNVVALFDPSGGRGIRASGWPIPPNGLSIGYAGGIDADNVVSIVEEIAGAGALNDYWIDMESGVRTDDRFDIDKVRAVLEAVAPRVSP